MPGFQVDFPELNENQRKMLWRELNELLFDQPEALRRLGDWLGVDD
jgi:hypothetical protein